MTFKHFSSDFRKTGLYFYVKVRYIVNMDANEAPPTRRTKMTNIFEAALETAAFALIIAAGVAFWFVTPV